jgi:hypothetical protein
MRCTNVAVTWAERFSLLGIKEIVACTKLNRRDAGQGADDFRRDAFNAAP